MNSIMRKEPDLDTGPQVSIIVVSYNTKEMTLKCLESVYAETHDTSFQLIIVDNASTDGSAEAIEELYADKALVISSEENLGFAAANNLAAKEAVGDFILLLNPDTEVIDRGIDKLVAFSDTCSDAEIWGGRTVFADESLNPASSWHRMTFWSLTSMVLGLTTVFKSSSFFNVEEMGGWDRSGEKHVDIVTGCFFLIRREFWNRLGGFDKDFFMYGEEADLCLRAAKMGANPIATSQATIIHHGGASDTVRADKMVRLLNAKYKLIHKHFPPQSRAVSKTLLTFWPMSRYLAHSILARLGRQSSREAAHVWKEIWDRRSNWTMVSS